MYSSIGTVSDLKFKSARVKSQIELLTVTAVPFVLAGQSLWQRMYVLEETELKVWIKKGKAGAGGGNFEHI